MKTQKLIMKKVQLIAIVIFFATNVYGSVITGNMSPMTFSPSSIAQAVIDIDNNGQFDFEAEIIYLGSSNYTLIFRGLNGTRFETDGNYELLGYNSGTPLGNNTYQDSGYVKNLYFPEGNIKFIGLKFKVNNVYHCAYFGARTLSYYQGGFDLWNYGYETNSNICITSDSNGTVGEVEKQVSPKFNVYPNPFSKFFKITFEESIDHVGVELYNINSQLIFKTSYVNVNKISYEVDKIPKGVYFLSVKIKNTETVVKIIKN